MSSAKKLIALLTLVASANSIAPPLFSDTNDCVLEQREAEIPEFVEDAKVVVRDADDTLEVDLASPDFAESPSLKLPPSSKLRRKRLDPQATPSADTESNLAEASPFAKPPTQKLQGPRATEDESPDAGNIEIEEELEVVEEEFDCLPVPDVPDVEYDDPDIIETEEFEGLRPSLMDTRPSAFCRVNFLSLNTTDDPQGTHLKLWDVPRGNITKFKLEKDPIRSERGRWENVKVLRRKGMVYSESLVFVDEYEGSRETAIGRALVKLFGLTKHYKGTILIDEYKLYPLWNVVLQDREELVAFVNYLQDNLEKRTGRRYFEDKPVLFLTLKTDPKLVTLALEDIALLSTMFDLVDYSDLKTTSFFNKIQEKFDRVLMHSKSNVAIYLGEGAREHILRKLESGCYEFKFEEIAPKFVVLVGSGLVLGLTRWFGHKFMDTVAGKSWLDATTWGWLKSLLGRNNDDEDDGGDGDDGGGDDGGGDGE